MRQVDISFTSWQTAAQTPKHRQVYAALRRDIQSGRLSDGARLPSEAELGQKFGASRITVGRRCGTCRSPGLVERRAGSGTFVQGTSRPPTRPLVRPADPGPRRDRDLRADLPGHDGARRSRGSMRCVWGSPNGERSSKEDRAWQLCRQYIDRRVSGVFFAPLELTPASGRCQPADREALDAARIPVVLLDRPALPYPRRGHHDLVGIDNRRAGYSITEHLCALGQPPGRVRRRPHAAATVDAREAGYREALYAANLADRARARRPARSVRRRCRARRSCAPARPDAIVCANDRTAARLMPTLLRLGYAIPGDVRLVGIDDVEYAGLLPVPLDDAAATDAADRRCGPRRHAGARRAHRPSPRGTCLLSLRADSQLSAGSVPVVELKRASQASVSVQLIDHRSVGEYAGCGLGTRVSDRRRLKSNVLAD